MQGDKNNYNMTFKEKLFFFFSQGDEEVVPIHSIKTSRLESRSRWKGEKKVNHKKINSIEILIVTDKETDLEEN